MMLKVTIKNFSREWFIVHLNFVDFCHIWTKFPPKNNSKNTRKFNLFNIYMLWDANDLSLKYLMTYVKWFANCRFILTRMCAIKIKNKSKRLFHLILFNDFLNQSEKLSLSLLVFWIIFYSPFSVAANILMFHFVYNDCWL